MASLIILTKIFTHENSTESAFKKQRKFLQSVRGQLADNRLITSSIGNFFVYFLVHVFTKSFPEEVQKLAKRFGQDSHEEKI